MPELVNEIIYKEDESGCTMDNAIEQAVQHLKQGGCILYPTDTVWGIGCLATDSNAIERLYQIKQRDRSKSMLILCGDVAMLQHYVYQPSPEALRVVTTSDRPTTVIFPRACHLPSNLLAADGSIGIRIPRMDFCQRLLSALQAPIVSTSANFSGMPAPADEASVSAELRQRLDYCVPDRTEFHHIDMRHSRIVRVASDGTIQILRD